MLDAHSQIWGMGEDSIFNGNLTMFRDELVDASNRKLDDDKPVEDVIKNFGKKTAIRMKNQAIKSIKNQGKIKNLKHVVDKMLFNYRNIGFIHLVYPNALIINTVRDPLDTLLSCYKSKFDDQGLEWALDIKHLVLQYSIYLHIMHHFRSVLPNRIIDIR
jgi:hypothetical protein